MLGEVRGAAGPSGADGTRWVVDPIDGTVNFARGIHVWATLIAVERDGELLAAVASAPALGQRWAASRGASTVLGGIERPIRVSTVERLEDAHLLHAGLANLETDGRGAGVATALGRAARDRGIGDFWGYMLVAQAPPMRCSRSGSSLGPRRARLIVAEAGGRFTDLDGSGPEAVHRPWRRTAACDELLEVLARA